MTVTQPSVRHVCSRCMSPTSHAKLKHTDSGYTCSECGKPWKVIDILDPQSVEATAPRLTPRPTPATITRHAR